MCSLLNITESILADILSNYIQFNDYGKFDIASSNVYVKKNLKMLTTNNKFILDVTNENYDHIFLNNNFSKWILLRQININKLCIDDNLLSNNNYISKVSSMIKVLIIVNINPDIDKHEFINCRKLLIATELNKSLNFNTLNCTNLESIEFINVCNTDKHHNYININNFVHLKTISSLKEISILYRKYLINNDALKFTDSILINLIQKYKKISSIGLFNCNQITDKSIIAMSICCKLNKLSLSNNYNITNSSINKLYTSNKNLIFRKENCSGIMNGKMLMAIQLTEFIT